MKKNILKKLFIKISKIMGYEIIDQTEFISPTLEKKLNDDLSIINDKSIVLPLGEVKITRKTKSILIILRINTEIESMFCVDKPYKAFDTIEDAYYWVKDYSNNESVKR